MSKTKLDRIKKLDRKGKLSRKGKRRKTWCDTFMYGNAYKKAVERPEKDNISLALPEEREKDVLEQMEEESNNFYLGVTHE